MSLWLRLKLGLAATVFPIAGPVCRSAVHILPVVSVPNHSLYANANPTYRTTTTAG